MSQFDRTSTILSEIAPGDGMAPRAWRVDEGHRIDLTGEWRFHHSWTLAGAPEGCDAREFDDSSWEAVTLPWHWVLTDDGRYGRPHYTNTQLPIPMDPPFVPDENPVGDHRRHFELPEDWTDLERIILRFDGIESIGIVSVNGNEVGVVRGSRLATEFDVTDLVSAGDNVLHVRVAKWSAQTYVEDQDQWWLPGIFREIALIGRPAGAFADHRIVAEYDHERGTGLLDVRVPGASFPVTVELPELDVRVTWEDATDIAPIEVGTVTPWSADRPKLYDLVISNDVDSVRTRTGFRTVTIDGNQWLVNGARLRLRGVNRHEYHPLQGRVFDEEAAREGMLLMKRHNINAIRTAHYPPHPKLFDLADELGFWVMDECDLESHAFEAYGWEGNPSDDPRWRESLVDRMRRTVMRDRNHPSIICWSVGNESGTGANVAAMVEEAHHLDPTRPVHYEPDFEGGHADVISRMYVPLPEMKAMSAGTTNGLSPRPLQASRYLDKPKILCEFVHAMGNGPGAIGDYVELFETLPDWTGGFIWEWRDHGIATFSPDGEPMYAYGGDFGERPHDGNFVMDGLVLSDGRPSPAMAEVRQQFSPVSITIDDAGISVENRFHAVDLSHLEFRWAWEVDGTEHASGLLEVALEPNAQVIVDLPDLPEAARARRDSFLTVTAVEREETPWAPAGHVVVRAQHRLDGFKAPVLPRPTRRPRVEEKIHVGVGRFDARSGALLEVAGHEIGDAGLELWRPPTDNDSLTTFGSYEVADFLATGGFGADGPSSAERWRAEGLDRLMRRTVSAEVVGDEFVVVQRVMGAQSRHGAEITQRWGDVDGALACRVFVAPIRPRTDLTWPRVGFHLLLPGDFSDAAWFGGGPGEAYADSRAASYVAEHRSSIDELAFPYAMPQETGHREQLRRLQLTGAAGELEIRAFGPDLPGFSLLRHDVHEITAARHQHELPSSRGLHLYLDAFQHGLGSRSCGPDVLPQHQLWPTSATFGFMIGSSM